MAAQNNSTKIKTEARDKTKSLTNHRYDFSILKFLRKQRSITLQELSKISGVSYAPLANLENNKIKPNLETLDKICLALEIPTYNLLALAERKSVEQLTWKSYDLSHGGLAYYDFGEYTVFAGEMKANDHLQGSNGHRMYFETVYVYRGELELEVQGKIYRLENGHSLYFDSIFEHRYQARKDTFLVIIQQKK